MPRTEQQEKANTNIKRNYSHLLTHSQTTMLSFKLISVTFFLALTSSSVANGLANCTKLNKITKFQTYDPYFGRTSDLNPPALATNATIIDFASFPRCELTITAITESGCIDSPIRCVRMMLGNQSHITLNPPYSLYGKVAPGSNILNYGKPHRGIQKLKACPFTDTTCTMGKGTCLEFMVEIKDSYMPDFILFDAELDNDGMKGYIYDQQSICLPKSGQVNIIALTGCYISEVDFLLTGGGKFDERTEYTFPFFLYGITEEGDILGEDGFMLDTEYTVSAIYDNDPSREIVRRFTFDQICP